MTNASLAKRLPIILIALVAITAFFTLRDQLSFDALATHRETLLAYRDANFLLSSLAFVAAYALATAFSLPGALIFTLTGGFLFGLFPGVLYNVTGATLGAIGIFLAARTGFGAALADRMQSAGGTAAKIQSAIRENEWSALFILRLVPAVPFFLANLIPAFTGTKLAPFAITTFLGIIPGALVFTSIGSGLGEVFATGATPDLSLFWQPHVIGPILGLAALSALPIFLKRRSKP
ncbi:MAG: hypothetical protein RLZZ437_649 [Pseudomonadota bacterium]|jgi:uncharacterized membrane protein YdjX (TVP38/TMEM64 family)